jgi:hypothetical protein
MGDRDGAPLRPPSSYEADEDELEDVPNQIGERRCLYQVD